MDDHRISRRQFITTVGAGAVATGMALGGLPVFGQEAPAQGRLFSFIALADPHLTEDREGEASGVEKFRRALAAIEDLDPQPDFMLMLGDIHPEALETLLPEIGLRIYPIAGNHEHRQRREQLRAQFEADFQGRDFYSFEHEGCLFIGICTALYGDHVGHFDSQDITPAVGQCGWLEGELARMGDYRHTILFGHVPPEAENRPSVMCLGQNDSRYLQDLVARHAPTALFFGHRHKRIWFDIDGVPVYGVRSCNWNGGGEPVGFLQVHLFADRMEVEFVDTSPA